MKSLNCPNCGGPLVITSMVGKLRCNYCDTDHLITKNEDKDLIANFDDSQPDYCDPYELPNGRWTNIKEFWLFGDRSQVPPYHQRLRVYYGKHDCVEIDITDEMECVRGGIGRGKHSIYGEIQSKISAKIKNAMILLYGSEPPLDLVGTLMSNLHSKGGLVYGKIGWNI